MRILFYLIGGERWPGVRERVLKYLPELRERGYECRVRTVDEVPPGRWARWKWIVAELVPDLKRADVFYNYRALFPSKQLLVIRELSRRVVFDFDDAVFTFPPDATFTPKERRDRLARLDAMLRACDAVVAGNRFLAEHARRYTKNVTVIPTCPDLRRYVPKAAHADDPTVGWIGMGQNTRYLLPIASALKGRRVKVVSDTFPELGFPYERKQWRLEDEIADLHSFDIGIMPLDVNEEWAKGKCAFKALQYMAVGVPVVLSPVGFNLEVVTDGVEGFFATTPEEWKDRLDRLRPREVRERMGALARERVRREFSSERALEKLIQVFEG